MIDSSFSILLLLLLLLFEIDLDFDFDFFEPFEKLLEGDLMFDWS
jgi:hypothetical protein